MPRLPRRPSTQHPLPLAAACRPRSRGRARSLFLGLFVTLLFGLLLGACGDREPEADKTPTLAAVEPRDVFTRQTPAKVAEAGRRRMLVVGDSLSISLGEQLEKALAGAPGLDYTWDGTRSTGLTRPDLLNWPQHLAELTARLGPDLVVIMLGANDTMPVELPEGGRALFGDPAWGPAYAAKARELLAICRRANPRVAVYWVGVPSMGEPTLAEGVRRINAVLRAMCADAGCRFIDTHAAFSDDEDRFSRHARDAATGDTVAVRTGDAVHLTEQGARLLAGLVLETLTNREKLPATAGIGELLARAQDLKVVPDPEAGQAKSATAKPSAAKPSPSGRTHVVRQGDTMAGIARRHGIDEEDLKALNPDADSRRLSIGQKLRLPRRK